VEVIPGKLNLILKDFLGVVLAMGDDTGSYVLGKKDLVKVQDCEKSCNSELPSFRDNILKPEILMEDSLSLSPGRFEENLITILILNIIKII